MKILALILALMLTVPHGCSQNSGVNIKGGHVNSGSGTPPLPPSFYITTLSLPTGTVNSAYSVTLASSGGVAPITWSCNPACPALAAVGLSLNSATGALSGTVTSTTGSPITFVAQAMDANAQVARQTLVLTLNPVLSSIALSADVTTIVRGNIANFTASGTYSDGSIQDVTTKCVWASSAPNVAALGASGANPEPVTGQTVGTSNITCAISGVTSPAVVLTVIAFQITTQSIPVATVGIPYSVTLTSNGGQNPVSWVCNPACPGLATDGLALSSASVISGTPSATTGSPISFTVQATDSTPTTPNVVTQALTLTINPAATIKGADYYCVGGTPTGGTDSIAKMPARCYQTAVSSTPSPGTVRTINTTTDWTNAVAAMACGDQLVITAGVTLSFSSPQVLPAKNCDNAHYITIRSSGTTDVAFPAEGTRMTPCYANKASYVGRDPYPCTTPKQLLATILYNATSGSGPLQVQGDHYRFIGLEVTRAATPSANQVADLVQCNSSACHHVIFDRMWIHGVEGTNTFPQCSVAGNPTGCTVVTATQTVTGVNFGQSNTVALIDSYVSDLYSNYGQGGADAKSFGGGTGTTANTLWGNWKIVNNHLEGAAEGSLLGGGGGPTNTLEDIPLDIEIRRNEYFKPLAWQPPSGGTPAGWPQDKNGFEFKTGGQMLIEGNEVKNVWFGGQVGQILLLNPRNQGPTGLCPTCKIRDVIVRYNYSYNTASGISLAVGPGNPCTSGGCQSLGMFNVSFHDFLGDYLHCTTSGCDDDIQITSNGTGPFNGLNLSHNTFTSTNRSAFEAGGALVVNGFNFTIQNNITFGGTQGFQNLGGTGQCDSGLNGNAYAVFNACWSTYTFTKNIIANRTGSNWPTDGLGANNFFPVTTAIQFVNYANGNGGDYHLQAGSPYHNAATDGTDLGANIDLVNVNVGTQY